MSRWSNARLLALTLAALLLTLLWDASGLDVPLAQWAGGPRGFPLRDAELLVLVLHEIPRLGSWLVVAALFVAVRWPWGPMRQLALSERVQLALTVIVSVFLVSLIKSNSHTSCPWDIAAFGGSAHYVSHWTWGVADGGPGHCFPAGHASAAFAYLGGWFVFRPHAPRTARLWFVAASLAGLTLGLAQQWRGAHYMSHTLWTAWICWSVGLAMDWGIRLVRAASGRDWQLAAGNVRTP